MRSARREWRIGLATEDWVLGRCMDREDGPRCRLLQLREMDELRMLAELPFACTVRSSKRLQIHPPSLIHPPLEISGMPNRQAARHGSTPQSAPRPKNQLASSAKPGTDWGLTQHQPRPRRIFHHFGHSKRIAMHTPAVYRVEQEPCRGIGLSARLPCGMPTFKRQGMRCRARACSFLTSTTSRCPLTLTVADRYR